MSVFCRKIKEDFTKYLKILSGLKISENDSIILEDGKGAHRKWMKGRKNLAFTLSNSGYLTVRQSKSLLIDYGFQVFVKDIEKPILRFDADGATHYNNEDENLSLLKREVKTPHFHKFDKNGREYAYRTDVIEEKEYEIQSNIQLGMYYFCDENYIQSQTGESLKIIAQAELFPDEVINDVHKGISFP